MSAPIYAAFRDQAAHCADLGSPFLARLCTLMARRLNRSLGPVARRLLSWPDPSHRADAVPLRFAAALHGLVLAKAAPQLAAVFPPNHQAASDAALWQAVGAAMAEHEDHIQRWLDHPPQTNEVRRAAALYLGLMEVAAATDLPVDYHEIGASAGLNLQLDRFAYRLGGLACGADAAPVMLAPDWRGPTPRGASVTIRRRRGCDARPLDPLDRADRLRLLSYIWPDQPERVARTQAAIDIARAHRAPVEQADAAAFVTDVLAQRGPGAATVIAHSIVWQYLGQDRQSRIAAAIESAGGDAGPDAPVAWVRLESDGRTPGAAVLCTLWTGSGAVRGHVLARCDFHGRWMDSACGPHQPGSSVSASKL